MTRGFLFGAFVCLASAFGAGCSSDACPEGKLQKGSRCLDPVAPLTLASSSPAEAAVDAPRQGSYVLRFSAPLDPTSVGEGVVVMKRGDVVVPVDVAVNAEELQITPRELLPRTTPHALTVSTALKGAKGEALAQEVALHVTTKDGEWSPSSVVRTPIMGATSSTAVVDDAGNVTVVWAELAGTKFQLWGNRYEIGSGWTQPELLTSEPSISAPYPRLAVDSTGNVTCVWRHGDFETSAVLWANRFERGIGWQGAKNLEPDAGTTAMSGDPTMTVDPQGNLTMVWVRINATGWDVWSKRYEVSQGWQPSAALEDNEGTAEVYAASDLAVDAQGNVVAIWHHREGNTSRLRARRYLLGSGWLPVAEFEVPDNQLPIVDVLGDAQGNVTLVWRLHDGIRTNLWANRFEPGVGWKDVGLLETSENSVEMAGAVIDSAGNVVVVWMQSAADLKELWANRFDVASGWSGAQPLTSGGTVTRFSRTGVLGDRQGNITVVWEQNKDSSVSLVAARWRRDSGWTSASSLEANIGSASFGSYNSAAVDAQGNVTVTWMQRDQAGSTVWANRFDVSVDAWKGPAWLASDDTGMLSEPFLAVNSQGGCNVFWIRLAASMSRRLVTSHYRGDTATWAPARYFDAPATRDVRPILFHSDNSGNGIALWAQASASYGYSLLASYFE
jgi:hypothetical protein